MMDLSKNDPFVRIMKLSDIELEEKLQQGAMASELQAFLGPQEYQELRELVQESHSRTVRGGERVWIVPGIMGSRLAVKKKRGEDLIWLEPWSLVKGGMAQLAYDEASTTKVIATGAISIYYLKLKLLLRLSGYDADYFPYDWRLRVSDSGKHLAEAIKAGGRNISLVCHSMGGLVARAMMKSDPDANKLVDRLIMLGTPHKGSFAAITTLRGTGSSVQKLAKWIDQKHTLDDLMKKVVSTFPGIHQLLPTQQVAGGFDIYNPAFWHGEFPKPHPDHLAEAAGFRDQLAPADERFFQISGVDQETVTGMSPTTDAFEYHLSQAGDGTVPLSSAKLDGATQYYVKAEHGGMANNRKVYRGIKDILAHGSTNELLHSWEGSRSVTTTRKVTDADLRDAVNPDEKDLDMSALANLNSDWLKLTRSFPGQVQTDNLSPGLMGSEPGSLNLKQLSVSRKPAQRLEIRLAHGSIADVDARAYVLGIFNGVAPTGAAQALDRQMNGVIEELTKRRMFHGNSGEIFMLPANRRRLLADFVVFVGLGRFDQFDNAAQELAGENIVRNLVQTYIEEFATVLVGAGSGKSIHASLESLLKGFVRGLQDADQDHKFRRITLCEYNPQRYIQLREALFKLSGSDLFGDIEVFFDEIQLPQPVETSVARSMEKGPEPIYLIVRRDEEEHSLEGDQDTGPGKPESFDFHASLLGAGNKATVITDYKTVQRDDLERLLKPLDNHGSLSFQDLKTFGGNLADLLLPHSIYSALKPFAEQPIVIVNDAPSSRLPWETLQIGDVYPAIKGGVVRRLLADNLSVAKWLEMRRKQPKLRILLIVNPTLDLEGAQKEGDTLARTFENYKDIEIDVLEGKQATKQACLEALSSGEYDVLHYAGHAIFTPGNPNRTGLICANKVLLRGDELTSLGSLPMLMVFNACEAARVRGIRNSVEAHIHHKIGFAEAFLRGGVANYVGTYWPVGDQAAASFAEYFYGDLLKGKSIDEALNHARQELFDRNLNEWANYIHYGGFGYRLKQPR
jgi:pimeloyl-ACP methyl ester carboxylesterase